MGGEQSSQERLPGAPVQLRKTCYYEVLGVERLASDDEIKKAYRKKALELHPDRNYGDVDNATKQFAEVQSAYQVLSDPQERAWYDSHRETILRNEDAGTNDHFEHNVRLTSAEDVISLVRKFTTNLSFDDKPNGFFGGLRLIFEKLAEEEAAACRWDGLDAVNWPGFGVSNDDYDQVIKPFYSAWMGFTTKKTYSWKETYNYAEAPDRRIRRLMEKENKHLREEAVRGFNDAVRSLVSFVRKRDPRYIPNRQSELDRQKILQDAAAAQAARSRAAHQAKIGEHIVPEWDKARSTEQDATFSDPELSDEEHFECVLCGKTFKSEKQYESHEKSKKHVKAVQQLRRQMHKEDKQLHLDGKKDLSPQLDETREEEQSDVTGYNPLFSQAEGPLETLSQDIDIEHDKDPNASTDEELSSPGSPTYSSNDEYISRAAVKDRLQPGTSHKGDEDLTSSVDDLDKMTEEVNVKDTKSHSERGKGKARRAKKATREEKKPGNVCVKCGNEFSSKTQLFDHINREGHAQATTQPIKAKREKRH